MELLIDDARLQSRNGIAVADRWLASAPHGRHYAIRKPLIAALAQVNAASSAAELNVTVQKGRGYELRLNALIVSAGGVQTVTGVVRFYVNGVLYRVQYQAGLSNAEISTSGGNLRGRQINAAALHIPDASGSVIYKVEMAYSSGYAVRNALFEVC